MLTLQPDSLDWALRHALLIGDTDVFPQPFEYEAIEADWANVKAHLLTVDAMNWEVRAHRSLLASKSRLGFRVVTQLDPLDFLTYAALVKELAPDIEARRVPVESNIVFSYRYNESADGRLFDPTIGYSEFQETSRAIVKARPDLTHVAITDISDFYPRLYHHRIDNALASASNKNMHVKAVMLMMRGWNNTETFGIPVGSAPTRLIAEATLANVDDALLANGITYVRFSDDFRLFASSEAEAYRHLAFLAEVLFQMHGLTLQQQKTSIVDTKTMLGEHASSPWQLEMDSLRSNFRTLIESLDLEDPYEPIDYSDLEAEQQAIVDSWNLVQLLEAELAVPMPDAMVVRFILRRLGQLDDPGAVDLLLDNLASVYPLLPAIVEYLSELTVLDEAKRKAYAEVLLDSFSDSVVGELPYYRMWVLQLFADSTDWNHADRFFRMLAANPDPFTRRKLILAMGRAGQQHWFQKHWRGLLDELPWARRALIVGASCMPPDARKHWYRAIEPRLDVLELAVMRWARANPLA